MKLTHLDFLICELQWCVQWFNQPRWLGMRAFANQEYMTCDVCWFRPEETHLPFAVNVLSNTIMLPTLPRAGRISARVRHEDTNFTLVLEES